MNKEQDKELTAELAIFQQTADLVKNMLPDARARLLGWLEHRVNELNRRPEGILRHLKSKSRDLKLELERTENEISKLKDAKACT